MKKFLNSEIDFLPQNNHESNLIKSVRNSQDRNFTSLDECGIPKYFKSFN